MAAADEQDGFNPDDLLTEEERRRQQQATQPPVTSTAAPPVPAQDRPVSDPGDSVQYDQPGTQPASAPVVRSPGTPYGNQPGSQDTGIATSTAATPQSSYSPPPGGYQYMEGVDTGKLNDPSVTSPKYIASRILASGGSVADAAKAVGGTVIDATRFKLPTGEVIDTRRDEEGANALQWLVMGDGSQAGGGDATAGAGGGASSLSPYGSGAGSSITGFQSNQPFGNSADSIEAAIMRLLARGEAPVDANDPNIAGPTAAYKAQQDTAVRRARNALAERDAAIGLNSGGSGSGSFDSGIQSQIEQEGRDVGSFQANQMTQELMARRQDVANALQFAQGDEKMKLQYTLAQMDDQLKRLGLSQQNNQFYDQFAYNIGKDQTNYDQLLTNYLLQ